MSSLFEASTSTSASVKRRMSTCKIYTYSCMAAFRTLLSPLPHTNIGPETCKESTAARGTMSGSANHNSIVEMGTGFRAGSVLGLAQKLLPGSQKYAK